MKDSFIGDSKTIMIANIGPNSGVSAHNSPGAIDVALPLLVFCGSSCARMANS